MVCKSVEADYFLFCSYMYCGIVDLTTLQSHEILDLLLSLDEFEIQPLITYVQKIFIENHDDFIIENFFKIIELTYQKNSFDKLWDSFLQDTSRPSLTCISLGRRSMLFYITNWRFL